MASFSYSTQQPENLRTVESVVGTVTTTYVGRAEPGSSPINAKWQISRVIEDSATKTVSVTYASGSALYDKVWTDYATYDYS